MPSSVFAVLRLSGARRHALLRSLVLRDVHPRLLSHGVAPAEPLVLVPAVSVPAEAHAAWHACQPRPTVAADATMTRIIEPLELVVTFLAAADGKLERFDRSDRLQEKLAVLEPVQAVAGLIGLLLLSGVTIFAGFLLRLGRPGIPAWAGTWLRRYPAQ